MSRELLFKSLKAVDQIERGLRGSDFIANCGKMAVDELMQYRVDLALDIYRVFVDDELPAKQMRRWIVEYLLEANRNAKA